MLKALAVLAVVVPSGAAAAPFAILHLDQTTVEVVDLGTLAKTGERARYEKVMLFGNGPELADGRLDRMIYRMEADCAGRRTRILALSMAVKGKAPAPPPWGAGDQDWTEVEPAELSLACTGQFAGLQVIPSLDVARAILNSGSGRSAD